MSNDDDRVGYGRPPRSGRFVKGISGNPSGRPRKRKAGPPEALPANLSAMDAMALRHAAKPLRIRQNGTVRTVETAEAILEAQAAQALKGGQVATRDYYARLERSSQAAEALREREFERWRQIDLENRRRLAQAEKAGLPAPRVYPHPLDIELKYDTRSVTILGPLSAEDEERYDWLIAVRSFAHTASAYRLLHSYRRASSDRRVCLLQMQSVLANRTLPPSMRWENREYRERDERLMFLPKAALKRYLRFCCIRLGVPAKAFLRAVIEMGETDADRSGIRSIFGMPIVDPDRFANYLRADSSKKIERLTREYVELLHHFEEGLASYQRKLIAKRLRSLNSQQ